MLPHTRLTIRALCGRVGTGLLVVLATLLVLPAAPAQAGTTLLCKGFTDCRQKGYVNYGYASVYQQMHWRMYGGHNCTNYAAYRMIQLGGPASRPWDGPGNASYWGRELAHLTNDTPTVNSVAWWEDRNHVQVVERVIDANTIVISEDHWGGDFDWAIVRRSSGHWPDGFIHIVKDTLAPSKAPSIPSQARVGQAVTASAGTWPAGSRLEYQWLASGWPIEGATSRTYVPRPQDAGKWLLFRVIASHPDYQKGKAYSQKSAPVALGVLDPDGAPTVTGQVKVGGTLQGAAPPISPSPTGVFRQWYADGVAIPEATGPSLALAQEHLGKRISLGVTATRSGYQRLQLRSAQTEPVAPKDLQVSRRARLDGVPRLGRTYTVDVGEIATPGATVTVRWFRDGTAFTPAEPRSYTLRAHDIGKQVSARVVWRKEGYDPLVSQFQPGTVLSVPAFTVTSPARRTVVIALEAGGVPEATGLVRILTEDGARLTGTLVDGRVRFSGDQVLPGLRSFRIRYFGDDLVAGRTIDRTLTVLGFVRRSQ